MSHTAAPLNPRSPSPSRRVGAARLGWAMLCGLAVLSFASPAAAQAPPATPTPPAPAPARAPALLRPPAPPPPPAPAPVSTRAAAQPAVQPVAPPPVQAAARTGPPPDSARPATTTVTAAPPANAVALCGDGTYAVAPADVSACRPRGGVRAAMPVRPPAPTPVSRAVTRAELVTAPAPNTPPPPGVTMRCKDGTYLGGTPSDGACVGRGGLAAALTAPREAPPPPSRPRRP
jgi:hypothetical protein